VRNISFPYTESEEEAVFSHLKKLSLKTSSYTVYKRSCDARRKSDIRFVLSVICEVADGTRLKVSPDVSVCEEDAYPSIPDAVPEKKDMYPVVCGFGPAGMFAALLLARHGFCPIVIEQGDDIDTRSTVAERYLTEKKLDTLSNIQFGEGGAGAFSDGKLITRINDPRTSFVLKTLHEHGAPKDVTTLAHPHIGTDLLRQVVKSIRLEIERLGGRVLFRHRLEDVEETGDGCVITLSSGEKLKAPALILATGHSSHATYRMLLTHGMEISAKDFSVGVRIEHLQKDVEKSLYGREREENDILPKAEYSVSYRENGRGCYSFCMCPGGLVMASASDENSIVTNGMSYHARDQKNSNSALAVSVLKSDFGDDPICAIEFQRELERRAFAVSGDFRAPAQTVGDFLEGRKTLSFGKVSPTYPHGVVGCLLDDVLPSFVSGMLKNGLRRFERTHSFFSDKTAPLTGVETRTSSPVRIARGDNLVATGFKRIYPCGEGAGWAGGITSAAVDGLKCAESYIKSVT